MIRINLLPVREARRQANLRQQGIFLSAAVGLAALVCIWMHLSIKSAQRTQNKQINASKQELQQLEATRKEVDRFRKEKEEIERKLAVIVELEQSRQGPVRILAEIATRIPKRVWLTGLEMNAGIIELEGVSLDAEIVAAFMATLGESEFISGIELDETRLEEQDGLKLNTFTINGRYGFGKQQLAAAGAT